ncbi:hypothetical protein KIL84_020974 [Mauremys mutica]|uniref:Uncharacterized protein n=1 Tax=Mauremys mutica TaxID=74926 RepID=A0A9D3XBZ6_9SAUR|nr:hypothetical protein KIL84_020974 [Mauremys mutica]
MCQAGQSAGRPQGGGYSAIWHAASRLCPVCRLGYGPRLPLLLALPSWRIAAPYAWPVPPVRHTGGLLASPPQHPLAHRPGRTLCSSVRQPARPFLVPFLLGQPWASRPRGSPPC